MLSVKSEYAFVTPEIARLWIDAYKYDLQRRVSARRVKLYAGVMKRGAWKQDKEIKFAVVDDKKYLVNGQHRLHAIVSSNCGQHFNVSHVFVDDLDEVAEIYNTEDMLKGRTFDDITRTMQLPELTGIRRTDLLKLKAAITFIDGDFGYRRENNADAWLIADRIVDDYSEAAGMFFEAISSAQRHGKSVKIRDRFVRSCVLSVGVVTYLESANRYGFQAIDDFWSGAASDDGLRRNDPRKVMLNRLVSTQMPSGTKSALGQEVEEPWHQARYVASCFNRWVSGDYFSERGGQPKIESEVKPIQISGSKYDGTYLNA